MMIPHVQGRSSGELSADASECEDGGGRLGFDGQEPEEAFAESQVMYMSLDDDLFDAVTGSAATCTSTECSHVHAR